MFRMKNKSLDGLDAKKIKSNAPTYIVLILAVGAMTFLGITIPSGGPTGPRGPAAHVDGDEVTFHDFKRTYITYDNYLRRQYGENYSPATAQTARRTLDELVNITILGQLAKKVGITVTDEQILNSFYEEEVFKDPETKQFSVERFKNYIRGAGYNSEAMLKKDRKRQLILQKLREFYVDTQFVSTPEAKEEYRLSETKKNVEFVKITPSKIKVEVTGEEANTWLADENNLKKAEERYESNKSKYNQEEQVDARHILVAFEGARRASGDAAKRKKADALKKAEELLGKVRAEGADFVAIAKEHTDEPSGKNSGGSLGFFTKDAMAEAFSAAAFKLKVGEISDVVETPFGYHIIKAEGRKEAITKNFDMVKVDIATDMIKKDKAPSLLRGKAMEVKDLLAKSGDEIKEGLKAENLKLQETGDFNLVAAYIPKIGSQDQVKNAVGSLKKPGDVAEPFQVQDSVYVVKLKTFAEADMSKFDEERKEQIEESKLRTAIYSGFTQMQQALRTSYEGRNAIALNPDYLAQDNPQQGQY